MQYQKYGVYIDSGAPWIGNVPSHWDVKKIGQCFQHRKEKVSDKDFEPLSVTMQGIVPQLETAAKSDSGDDRKKVCVGDFVINSRSDRKGSSGVSALDGSVSLISIILKPLAHNKGYVHHLLRSFEFQEEFYRNGKGIVADLWSTKYSDMKNIKVPIPPYEEQKVIAEFINKKTSQIDTHIDKQERLFALLKERRTAIINKAVTRGIDKKVKLKDSGIVWIGEIPEHWEVKKLKYVIRNSTTQVSKMKPDDIYIEMENVESSTGKLLKFSTEASFDSTARVFSANDVLFGKLRPYLAKAVIAPHKGVCVGEFLVFKPSDKIYTEYLHVLLLAKQFIDLIDSSTYGTKMPRANWDFIGNQYIPIPKHNEQQLIADFIKKENKKIDNALNIIKEEITALKEYRQSLISNAVTGKIKVVDVCKSKED